MVAIFSYLRSCVINGTLACVQTSPLPQEKSGEETPLAIFPEGVGTSEHRLRHVALKKAVIGAINKREIIVLLYFQLVVLSFPYGGSTT